MASPTKLIDVRVRTLGEILDDAWRLFLLDAGPLLFLMSIFSAPWAAAGLWTLTRSSSDWQWLWPLITAILLLLGAWGPAVCQEYLRQRAAGRRPTVRSALRAGLAKGLSHLGMRALGLTVLLAGAITLWRWFQEDERMPLADVLVYLFGPPMLLLPGLICWMITIPGYSLISAGVVKVWDAHRASRREVGRQLRKAIGLVVTRLLLILFLAFNLDAVVGICLWLGDNFLGLEVAYLDRFLGWANTVYLLALFLFSALLLAPYMEIVNYLFHLDARARYEGLDLWYRVQRQFPAPPKAVVAASVAALLCFLSLGMSAAQAAVVADNQAAVRELRQAVQELLAQPSSPGGNELADRLPPLAQHAVNGGAPPVVMEWCRDAAREIRSLEAADARAVLQRLEQRLALLEQSLVRPDNQPSKERIKELAGATADKKPKASRPKPPEPPPPPDPPPERRVTSGPPSDGPRQVSAPVGGSVDLSGLVWFLLIAIGVVVIVVVVQAVRHRQKPPPKPEVKVQAHPEADLLEKLLSEPVRPGVNRWQHADDLAAQGDYPEAVRMLYLAVLVMLHQANLIRYERTRTNGEYVRQLRSRPALQRPFRTLTTQFELKWYGKRPCALGEYHACRDVADQLLEESRRHG